MLLMHDKSCRHVFMLRPTDLVGQVGWASTTDGTSNITTPSDISRVYMTKDLSLILPPYVKITAIPH